MGRSGRSALLAALFGVFLLFGVGFSHIEALHNAAHDTRHAAAFPATEAGRSSMAMFRSLVFAAALAGLLTGVLVTIAQQLGTVPLILAAEVFEQDRGLPPETPRDRHTRPGAHEHEAWAPRTASSATPSPCWRTSSPGRRLPFC